jgi:hypothetical protein
LDPLLKATDSKEDIELTLAEVAPLGMSRKEVVKLLPKLGIYDSVDHQNVEHSIQTAGGAKFWVVILKTAFIPKRDPTLTRKMQSDFLIYWSFDAADHLTRIEVRPTLRKSD